MQEFLTNNTVNCNLMSLTGYRTLVLLSILMESPKSNDEINHAFLNNQYIKEKFSNDTLRIYINSLRAIGCDITKADKSNNHKYELLSHPFAYDITSEQLNAISKMYKSLHDKVDIRTLIKVENLFKKLLKQIKNEDTKKYLLSLSLLKNLDEIMLNDLILHCKNKNQIVILYKSPKSGLKEIEIVADKLSFKSEKLYLWGNNLTHEEYSYLLVERISEISSIKLAKNKMNFVSNKILFELKNHPNFIPQVDEKILENDGNKIVVEMTSKSNFNACQRLLHLADDCKVISPENFKNELTEKIKLMKEIYERN